MVLAAVGQICSTASMSHNLAQCQTIIRKAISAGAKALFLPEASDYISQSSADAVSFCRSTQASPFVQGLQQLARTHSLPINVGIHEPTDPPSSRIRNTLVWISAAGDITHRYQKLHMFDIDLRPDGPYLRESNSTEPGNDIVQPYDASALGLGSIGSLICFDVRFVEPSITLRRLGAQTLLYPSAFTVPTGKAHWEVLMRARAIENQCYVIASAQCGRHNSKRVSYGDSLVINPRGEVIGRLERVEDAEGEVEGAREPTVLVVDIDLQEVDKVRKGIPWNRRTDVYPQL